MTTELACQSRECEKISQKNRQLRLEIARMKTQIHEQAENEHTLATRTHFFSKLLKKLKEKIETSTKLTQDYRQTVHARQQANQYAPVSFASEELIKSLRARYEEMVQSYSQAQSKVDELESEFKLQRDLHDIVLSSQDAVTTLLLTCLEDVKVKWATEDHVTPAPAGATQPLSLETLNAAQRERVLARILQRLYAYQNAHQVLKQSFRRNDGVVLVLAVATVIFVVQFFGFHFFFLYQVNKKYMS